MSPRKATIVIVLGAIFLIACGVLLDKVYPDGDES